MALELRTLGLGSLCKPSKRYKAPQCPICIELRCTEGNEFCDGQSIQPLGQSMGHRC